MPGFFSSLFAPRYIQDGQELLDAARKLFRYKSDLLSEADAAQCRELMGKLETALAERPREALAASQHSEAITALSRKVEAFFARHFPDSGQTLSPVLQENCEVFLVAILIAFAIRTYFLQPFTIPTGSMFPTLNGIMITATAPSLLSPTPDSDEQEPGWLGRAADTVRYGRSWFRAVAQEDDTIRALREVRKYWFINYTLIECDKQTFKIPAPMTTVLAWRRLEPMRTFDGRLGNPAPIVPVPVKAGEVVAQGYVDTGDHVFVNKMAYHFRRPRRGEVFVFSTAGVPTDENSRNPNAPSQYYIKRLAGLPGDELRIDPPRLFVNGELAQEPGFARVMQGLEHAPQDGYRGYGNGPGKEYGGYLSTPASPFRLPERRYFALGDNSYNSSDSRVWGTVPEENLVGCGLVVYWPFAKHWGWIR